MSVCHLLRNERRGERKRGEKESRIGKGESLLFPEESSGLLGEIIFLLKCGEKIINVSSQHSLTSLALILFLCFPFLVPFPTSFFYVVPHSWVVIISRKPPWLSNLRLAVCAFKCIPSITDISVTVFMPHCFIISVSDSN